MISSLGLLNKKCDYSNFKVSLYSWCGKGKRALHLSAINYYKYTSSSYHEKHYEVSWGGIHIIDSLSSRICDLRQFVQPELFGKQLHADAAGKKCWFKKKKKFKQELIEGNLSHTELQLYLEIVMFECVKQFIFTSLSFVLIHKDIFK